MALEEAKLELLVGLFYDRESAVDLVTVHPHNLDDVVASPANGKNRKMMRYSYKF